MPFTRILVAIDGSPGGQKALATAIELASLTGAMLTALAVEGKLPAYAATIGEVDEVRRRKDEFFEQLARAAREQADAAGVDLEVDVRPGHAARVRVARYEGESDYSAEIERTFSKFEQGATKSYLVELPEGAAWTTSRRGSWSGSPGSIRTCLRDWRHTGSGTRASSTGRSSCSTARCSSTLRTSSTSTG
jgi:hypothetical protein